MLLNTHTYYSLRFGVLSPSQLLKKLEVGNWSTVALTDVNNTSAAMDFVRMAPKYGIKPVLGIDFRNGAKQKYVALAKNNAGWQELNEHLSYHLHNQLPFNKPRFSSDIITLFPSTDFPENLERNEYVGIGRKDLIQLKLGRLNCLEEKQVLLHSSSFQNKRDFNIHKLLRCVENNCLLSKLPKEEVSDPENLILSKEDFVSLYADFPVHLERANEILESCEVHFDFGRADEHHNLRSYTNIEALDFRLMKHICYKNLEYRYPNPSKAVLNRISKELKIILQKRFVSYFLINWKIVKYARAKGYFYVGRGSGANSIIAYLMRITDVDPIELDLYFERFINLYRVNPPDFDIDFSWSDRDDIIQFIFSRFKYVSLLGTYVTFQYKAVIRELGKVFGLPKSEIDKLTRNFIPYDQLDDVSKQLMRYGSYIQDFPNYLSVHAGGILITDKPITYFTATFMPPKGFQTTHFDMVVAEDISIYKFDILSQRGLGKIRDALEMVQRNYPEKQLPDIHDIRLFKEDVQIKSMLRNAKAIGCFYVESPAMRMLMKKLQVDDYLGLVAASSVIRPGVAKSGMMKEYILRYRFPEKRKDGHPLMIEIMPETFGVMVYQEDVIKVAHYFAGLSLAEADVLRRGMSGKFRGRDEFEKARIRFFEGCKEKGYTDSLSKEVWRQIESFAGYAFAKGHSASYAVESYQSLYLKSYYPLEYMVATLNNGGGFYSPELYLHEARMLGGIVENPCVNRSIALCELYGKTIVLGFGMIKDLSEECIRNIITERINRGEYTSLLDFMDRVSASLEQVHLLIKIGAFHFTSNNKKRLLWEAHFFLNKTPRKVSTPSLFDEPPKNFQLPQLDFEELEDAYDEIELLGFPLSDPFQLYSHDKEGVVVADLASKLHQKIEAYGYLITVKTTRTSRGQAMFFANFIDAKGEFLDTVHFPDCAARYPFRGKGVYCFFGKVVEEFDCYTIEVEWMKKIDMKPDPRYADIKRKIYINSNRTHALPR